MTTLMVPGSDIINTIFTPNQGAHTGTRIHTCMHTHVDIVRTQTGGRNIETGGRMHRWAQ